MHRCFSYLMLFLAGPISLQAQLPLQEETQLVRTEYRNYTVEFSGGKKQKQSLQFSGTLTIRKYESGAHSSWEHPIDTRQCHWEIRISLYRKLCLYSNLGDLECGGADPGEIVYTDSKVGQGKDWTEMIALSSENCGECGDRILQDASDMRQLLTDNFMPLMNGAVTEFYNHLKENGKIISITPEKF